MLKVDSCYRMLLLSCTCISTVATHGQLEAVGGTAHSKWAVRGICCIPLEVLQINSETVVSSGRQGM